MMLILYYLSTALTVARPGYQVIHASVDYGARSLLGNISSALRTSIVLLTTITISGALYFIPFALYHLVDEEGWSYVAMMVSLLAFAFIGNIGEKQCPRCKQLFSRRTAVCPSCNFRPAPRDLAVVHWVNRESVTHTIIGMACGLVAGSAIRAAQTLAPSTGDGPSMTYAGIALFGVVGALLGYCVNRNGKS